MQYRKEIDGLRAVAVLPVILFHAGFSIFSGGYIGVDVFFVISGYLITSILISEMEQGNLSILRFYERRARRILPALFFVMLICLPFAYMWMLPSQLEDFGKSLIAVVFFGSNVLFWRESGYFGAAAELKPLLHTWSLAVEEQFYLVFPIFLVLAWRFGRNMVFWSIVAIAAFSLLLSEWGWRNSPSANFYLAPTRAWELLAGSICAFLTVGQKQRSSNFLSALGLTLIIFGILIYNESTPFPSVYALAPVAGTALIILFADKATWTGKLLSMPGFVGIGLVSYSAYLWHQPLFAFARLRNLTEPSLYLMAALAGAALVLAWATWRWVEEPFRKHTNPVLVARRSVFAVSGVVGVTLAAIGLAGHLGDGFKWRLTEYEQTILEYSNYPREGFYREGLCFLRPEQSFSDFSEVCSAHMNGIIVGDSHAAAISSFLSSTYEVGQLTASGCPPVLNLNILSHPHCTEINNLVFDLIPKLMSDFVILHANWNLSHQLPGFESGLNDAIELVLASGSIPIVVGTVPQFPPSLPDLVLRQKVILASEARVISEQEELRDLNSELEAIAINAGALYWDPIQYLCDDDQFCLVAVPFRNGDALKGDAALIAWDYGHLTYSGAAYVGELLMDYIRN